MTPDLSWQDTAACRDQPPDLFFSEATYDQAKQVCARCDHVDTCIAYALELGCTDGVYGGTSPRQRSKLARTRRRDSLATCAICKRHLLGALRGRHALLRRMPAGTPRAAQQAVQGRQGVGVNPLFFALFRNHTDGIRR